jgi:hypothetical protein
MHKLKKNIIYMPNEVLRKSQGAEEYPTWNKQTEG